MTKLVYKDVCIMSSDKKGKFGQTTVGKRILKHVLKALKAGCAVNYRERVVGGYRESLGTKMSNWRVIGRPHVEYVDADRFTRTEIVRTVLRREETEIYKQHPLRILADIEIIS